jgi:para-nitrobenzyl esterase
MDLWAAEQQKGSRRIYTYFFDRPIPWPAHPEFGAFHTGEVPYVFRTIDRLNRPWEAVDRTLADNVSSYWANFARKGDPNGVGLPRWPEYVPGSHITMQLGARLGTMSVAEGPRLDFFLGLQKLGSQP